MKYLSLILLLTLCSCVSKDRYEQTLEEKNRLSSENKSLELENSSLGMKVSDLEEENQLISEEYNKSVMLIQELNNEFARIDRSEAEILQLIPSPTDVARNANSIELIKDKRDNIEVSRRKINSLIQELQSVSNRNDFLQNLVTNYEQQLKLKNKEIQNLKSTIKELEVVNKQLKAQIDFDIATYTQKLANMEQENDDLARERRILRDENKKLFQIQQIFERESDSLKSDLKVSRTLVDSLDKVVFDYKQAEKFTEDCNYVYYLGMSKKELKDLELAEPQKKLNFGGDFILSDGYLNKLDYFTRLEVKNLNEFSSFDFDSKILQIIPPRPTDTYSYERRSLYITDPEQFWKTSKILVAVLGK